MHQVISKRLLVVIALLFVLDVSFSPIIAVGGAKISFLSLLVLYIAFDWGWPKAVPVAIIVGILKDLYGSAFLGLETFSLVFAVFVFDGVLKKTDKKNWLIRLPAVFMFITLYQLLNYFLILISGRLSVFAWHQIGVIFSTALYHMLVFGLFFKISVFIFDDQRRVHQYELFH